MFAACGAHTLILNTLTHASWRPVAAAIARFAAFAHGTFASQSLKTIIYLSAFGANDVLFMNSWYHSWIHDAIFVVHHTVNHSTVFSTALKSSVNDISIDAFWLKLDIPIILPVTSCHHCEMLGGNIISKSHAVASFTSAIFAPPIDPDLSITIHRSDPSVFPSSHTSSHSWSYVISHVDSHCV